VTACSSAADVVVLALGVGVGEDVVGFVHPAARIAAISPLLTSLLKTIFSL
jgi:hypothetical protein